MASAGSAVPLLFLCPAARCSWCSARCARHRSCAAAPAPRPRANGSSAPGGRLSRWLPGCWRGQPAPARPPPPPEAGVPIAPTRRPRGAGGERGASGCRGARPSTGCGAQPRRSPPIRSPPCVAPASPLTRYALPCPAGTVLRPTAARGQQVSGQLVPGSWRRHPEGEAGGLQKLRYAHVLKLTICSWVFERGFKLMPHSPTRLCPVNYMRDLTTAEVHRKLSDNCRRRDDKISETYKCFQFFLNFIIAM